MKKFVALVSVTCISMVCFGGSIPATATIYDANIEGRIELTARQKPKVQEILNQSDGDLERVLRKNGIDPNNTQPPVLKLLVASRELASIGRRTRSQLAEILDSEQLRQYDEIIEEVEQRIKKSVWLGDRRERGRNIFD